jgi:hypothetical protein
MEEIIDFKQLHMSAVCDGLCKTVEPYNDPLHTVENLLYKLERDFPASNEYLLIIHPITLRKLLQEKEVSLTYRAEMMGIETKETTTLPEGSILLLHPRAVLLSGEMIKPHGVGYANLGLENEM